jgi:hypothetical protein
VQAAIISEAVVGRRAVCFLVSSRKSYESADPLFCFDAMPIVSGLERLQNIQAHAQGPCDIVVPNEALFGGPIFDFLAQRLP